MATKKKTTTKVNTQSGQEGVENPKAATKAKKAAVEEQFAEADAKGAPEQAAIEAEAIAVRREVSGF